MFDKWKKESFVVIGKEGSTEEGDGFVCKLWADANAHAHEVMPLVQTDETGKPLGAWGAMSDFSRSFQPWEDGFSKGLYLAGMECRKDAAPPQGWVKWRVPGFIYLRVPAEENNAFKKGLACLREESLTLKGAVQEFTDMKTGKSYMCFPIERLDREETATE